MSYKILVVEDDQFFREVIVDILSKKYEVLSAADGNLAKEMLIAEKFDLVLSDIQMPGLSGVELLEWTLKNGAVPYILMTGYSIALESTTAFDLGAKGFFAKPFKNSELTTVVEGALAPAAHSELIATSPVKSFHKSAMEDFMAKIKST